MIDRNFRHLRAFIAVAEDLHFGRAALRLHIVQPALTMQIQGLEQMLGVSLLRRNRRVVELTEPGRLFLAEAYRTLQQAERSVDIVRRAARGEAGHLVIGYSGAVAYSGLLSRMIRDFRQGTPAVQLSFKDMHPALQREAVLQGDLDLGLIVAHESGAPSMLEARIVERWSVCLALPSGHRLAQHDAVTLDCLEGELFISYSALGEDLGVDALQQAAGFTPTVAYEAENPAMVLSLVAAELGIALVPEGLQQINMPGVTFRKIVVGLPLVPVTALYRRDAMNPVLQRFLASIPD